MSHRRWGTWLLDWSVLFLIAAALIWPLFKVKYLDLWPSIESTFIADARFLAEHWPHPNWQPNWYCGTRTDYVYPPALRYGTAALARYYPNMLPVRAYHIYIAFFYCFGIAAVYLLARQGSGSRAAGGLAALATALVSPSYLFIASIRGDAPLQMPYRLNVLIRYGEGPHISSLAWIPLALFFSWRALDGRRLPSLAAAAFCSAMVVANNFYGATSLAMLFPILAWAVYITRLDRTVWLRAAAIAAIAYGLSAFWLDWSYLKVTVRNMQFVSSEGNLWSRWVALGYGIAYLLLSDKFARARPDRAWITFVTGAAGFFFVNVVGNHYLNFRIIGEPSRLVPELDLVLLLFAAELLRRLWSAGESRRRLRVAASAAAVLVLLAASGRYVLRAHTIFQPYPDYRDRVEYELQDWVAKNLPGSRTLPAGAVRFWYNAWHDLPQVGGGSEQGLLNPRVVPPQWQIYLGPEADMSILWMQILGVDAVIVNGPGSRENYKDFVYPEKFKGLLPVLYDNGRGDTIYGVPRRFRSLARVVDRASFDRLREIPGNGDMAYLQAWHDVIEKGAVSEAPIRRENTDTFHLTATLSEGQSVWIQESYDLNWHAWSGDLRLPVRKDNMGFMVIDAPPGTHHIRMRFPTPVATHIGRLITLLSAAVAAALVWKGR